MRTPLSFIESPAGFDLSMDPGRYRVRAYRDLDRNKVWKRELEPASAESDIDVPPGGSVEAPALVLVRAAPGGGGP